MAEISVKTGKLPDLSFFSDALTDEKLKEVFNELMTQASIKVQELQETKQSRIDKLKRDFIADRLFQKEFSDLSDSDKEIVNNRLNLQEDLLGDLRPVHRSWDYLKDKLLTGVVYEAAPLSSAVGGTISARRLDEITVLRIYKRSKLGEVRKLEKEKDELTNELFKLREKQEDINDFELEKKYNKNINIITDELFKVNNSLNKLCKDRVIIKIGESGDQLKDLLLTANDYLFAYDIIYDLIDKSSYSVLVKRQLKDYLSEQFSSDIDYRDSLKKIIIDSKPFAEYEFSKKLVKAGVRVPDPLSITDPLEAKVFMAFEFIDHVNLYDFLKERKRGLIKVFNDLAKQVSLMHKAGVFHGDLAIPDRYRFLFNVIVSNNGGEVFLIDFDFSLDKPGDRAPTKMLTSKGLSWVQILGVELACLMISLPIVLKSEFSFEDQEIIKLFKSFVEGTDFFSDDYKNQVIDCFNNPSKISVFESLKDELSDELFNSLKEIYF